METAIKGETTKVNTPTHRQNSSKIIQSENH